MTIVYSALLVALIFLQIFRFLLHTRAQRWVLFVGGSVIWISAAVWFSMPIALLSLGVVGFGVITFSVLGGIIGAVLVILWQAIWYGIGAASSMLLMDVGVLLFGIAGGIVARGWRRRVWERYLQLQGLYSQARELQFLREFSLGMQSTFDVEKLLHVVLTAITAGSGLGLNRAMLLLRTEDHQALKGAFAIGPMSEEEGYQIWNRLVEERWDLRQLMDRRDRIKIENSHLNDVITELQVPLTAEGGILAQVARDRRTIRVHAADSSDPFVRFLHSSFDMSSFAVIPLVSRGSTVGLILVDNVVSHKPITLEKLESVAVLARHAASAIENASLYQRMESLAVTDGLTGLYNHRYFSGLLEEFVQEYHSNGRTLSLILLDIDDFKHYNDSNGHLAGNDVLQSISQILRKSVRSVDVPCRFGGEEFAVLLPDTDEIVAKAVAQGIHENVRQASMVHGESQPLGRVTVSVGVCGLCSEVTSAESLVRAADAAMYQAKATGKDQVIVYTGGDSYVHAMA